MKASLPSNDSSPQHHSIIFLQVSTDLVISPGLQRFNVEANAGICSFLKHASACEADYEYFEYSNNVLISVVPFGSFVYN